MIFGYLSNVQVKSLHEVVEYRGGRGFSRAVRLDLDWVPREELELSKYGKREKFGDSLSSNRSTVSVRPEPTMPEEEHRKVVLRKLSESRSKALMLLS